MRFKSICIFESMQDYDDWLNFYDEVKKYPAMNEHCNNGGRYLHWIGYRWSLINGQHKWFDLSLRSEKIPERSKGSDFQYLGKYEPLLVKAWRPLQPNGKRPDQCLSAYLGLEPNASWYELIFEQAERLKSFERRPEVNRLNGW